MSADLKRLAAEVRRFWSGIKPGAQILPSLSEQGKRLLEAIDKHDCHGEHNDVGRENALLLATQEELRKEANDWRARAIEARRQVEVLRRALELVLPAAESWADGDSRSSPIHETVAAARAALAETEGKGE